MSQKKWFEVSVSGLRELQLGKPKHYIARELIQNAFDENISRCSIDLTWTKGIAKIRVLDDSPEGFKDLTDAYTVFKETSKRSNPTKRGRFNLGEKQAIALADYAKIETTKGSVLFNKDGRFITKKKRITGSQVTLNVKMTKKEYDEILEILEIYLPPEKIDFFVNNTLYPYKKPFKIIKTTLETELLEFEMLKNIQRKTQIHILEKVNDVAWLYEMGIPVCQLDCKYSLDIQQKIPLSVDREKVPPRYLKRLFAEVLNETFEEIQENESSEVWVRQATASKQIKTDAIKEIIQKRFGDKVVVANPFDKVSIDDALSKGYKVVRGSELSKPEWDNVKKADAMMSSSEKFGHTIVASKPVKVNAAMLWTTSLAKKIAKECLDIDIDVKFASWKGNTSATYGNQLLTFNVSKVGRDFFKTKLDERVLDLIIHELGHEKGMHTETAYHRALTQIGSKLIMFSLEESTFFNIE